MPVILLVLGILLTAAGAAAIGFGLPINDLSRGSTLILAGVFGLVGGLLLIGLAAVAAEVRKVVRALHARPAVPHPVARTAETTALPADTAQRESPPAEPVAAAPAPSLEVSASAIERLRSSIPRAERSVPEAEEVPLSPNGQHQPAPVESSAAEPAPRAVGAAAVETREPKLDFLFRARPARPAQQPEFDSLWPKRATRETLPDPRLEVARAPAATSTADGRAAPIPPAAPAAAPAAPQPADEARTVAILKSGVVDGMAYTLYADGSIEAQLPQGTVRFGSIAELRAHIESNTQA
jgi:hypothetical protein